jgi:apolipoprotein N-acyltransferase
VDIDPANNLLNTAAYFDAAGNFKDRYDKVQIVPIGEYFPLRSLLGSIYKQYGVPDQDMVAGRRSGLMTLPAASGPITTGAMICYDDVFTTQARARVRGGAEALVLITSDQTFGTTAGPQQHADLDVLRAVETDRYLVRAGATGPSEVVCPDGEIQSLLPIDRKGVLRRTIYSVRGETCFVRAGDYLPVICLAGCVLAALAAIWRQATKAG